jgi:hypothetical protein
MRSDLCGHFLHFAFTGKRRRIRATPRPINFGTDRRTGRLSEQAHFFKLFRNIVMSEIKLDDYRTFTSGRTFKHSDVLRKDDASRENWRA